MIVYFGNDWRAENRTSSHHIARCLAKRFPLLYIDCPTRAPQATGRDFRKAGRIVKKLLQRPQKVGEQMWHATIPQLPFRRIALVRRLNRHFGIWMVNRAIRRLGFRDPVLWFAAPPLAPVVGNVGECFVVYYCIDDYAGLPHVDVQEVRRLDHTLTQKAGQLFVSSEPLLEKKKSLNATARYSPHGVDFELFRQAADPSLPVAEPLRNLKHPIIGFYGSISGWIDLELIAFIAKAEPDWKFVLIGYISVDVTELKRLPNVLFFDAQPYSTLPHWLKAFDVGLQPYILNSQTYHSNPLKLREYLSAGKPVVSISVPEVDRFAGLVGIARTHAEFLERVRDAIRMDSPERRKERQAAVAKMSWEARVDEAWAVVERRMTQQHVPAKQVPVI